MKLARNAVRRLTLESLETRQCLTIGEPLSAVWEQQLRDVLQSGGEIDLPAGIISLEQPLRASPSAGPITIRGSGIAKTVIEIDYDGKAPLLAIANTGAPIHLSGMTLSGNDHSAIGVQLVGVSNFEMARVELTKFQESALTGKQLEGARFEDCYFVRSGDAASDSPAVVLGEIDVTHPATNSSNNVFLACRWENNEYVGLRLNRAVSTDIVGSKFHGILPEGAPYDHLQSNRTVSTRIIANNFVRSGSDAIQIWESALTEVALNQISQNDGFGVKALDSPTSYVADNAFAPYAPLSNGLGDVWSNKPLAGHASAGARDIIAWALNATHALTEHSTDTGASPATTLHPGDDLSAALERGGVFVLEPGVYEVSQPIVVQPGAKLSLRGAGSGQTILRVTGDFPGAAFSVAGSEESLNKGLEISGMSIEGQGRSASCFRLDRVMHANFTDVEVRDFAGKAVDGTQFWDSVFRDCRFVRCGSAASESGAITLRARDNADAYTSSNNIMFLGCDFVGNAYTSIELERLTSKVRILDCDFLQTPASSGSGVRMEFLSSSNIVAGNVFHDADPNILLRDQGAGNIIAASLVASLPPAITPPTILPPAIAPPPASDPPMIVPPSLPVASDWRLARGMDDAPRPIAPPPPPAVIEQVIDVRNIVPPPEPEEVIPRRRRFLARG